MHPIVNGIESQYSSCLVVERVSFHTDSYFENLIGPLGTPEFALLDLNDSILHRWAGFTEPEEFAEVLDPICKS
jgi:hypothetical protein